MAAIAAVLGLAFIGSRMNDDEDSKRCSGYTTVVSTNPERADADFPENPTIRANRWSGKQAMNFSSPSPMASRDVHGQPVYNFDSRQPIGNLMNNLNPNPWTRVGPGLGIPANVPAYGGHQQLLRVLPTNTNEYRLTQLKGNSGGPPKNLVPGPEAYPVVARNRPDTDCAPGYAGNAAAATVRAPEARAKFVKGTRWTKRDVTVTREDDLEYGPPLQVKPLNSGYVVTGNQQLDRRDARAKPDRAGNAGRMNVRADPVGAGGAMTTVRVDSVMAPPPPVGRRQNPESYVRDALQQANPFKETLTPLDLDIAKRQLADNPANHTLSG
jgi:hypothetical protein